MSGNTLPSGNASDAYRRAGYSAKDVDVAGPRLLGNVGVAAAIKEGRARVVAKADEEFDIRLSDVLFRLKQIASVDRNELTQYRRGACRYCHGIEHHFQWKTPREFTEAVELHKLKGEAAAANHLPPKMEGGYGYKITADPNPDCPECAGLGIGYTVFADTTKLSPGARILFGGVKETKNGLQVVMPGRLAALIAIGKHLGMFPERHEHTGKSGKPIETRVRVVIVPAKIPAVVEIDDMDDDEVDP